MTTNRERVEREIAEKLGFQLSSHRNGKAIVEKRRGANVLANAREVKLWDYARVTAIALGRCTLAGEELAKAAGRVMAGPPERWMLEELRAALKKWRER